MPTSANCHLFGLRFLLEFFILVSSDLTFFGIVTIEVSINFVLLVSLYHTCHKSSIVEKTPNRTVRKGNADEDSPSTMEHLSALSFAKGTCRYCKSKHFKVSQRNFCNEIPAAQQFFIFLISELEPCSPARFFFCFFFLQNEEVLSFFKIIILFVSFHFNLQWHINTKLFFFF